MGAKEADMRTIKESETAVSDRGGRLGWFPLHFGGGYTCTIRWREGEMRLARPNHEGSLVFFEEEKNKAYNLAADWAEKYLKPKGE